MDKKEILQEDREAYAEFFIVKKWIKTDKELLKKEYEDKGLDTPCDGLVKTKDDAIKATRYYKAFYNKLVLEGPISEDVDKGFKRILDKYNPDNYS